MKAHKDYLILFLAMIVIFLSACSASKEIIDYGDAAAFETALNSGENLEGKTVQIIVDDMNPATISGYDIYAGEHLNFVSSRHPDVKKGDTIVVRATTIESALGSWIIQYEKVENAVVGDTTIFSDSTITAASMPGTYAGKNGSILILREDGTTAYYYMKSDEIENDSGNTWSYADKTLTWAYNGTEVSGTVADDMSFTLKAQKEFDGWVRETFFKVSDDTVDKTVSECRQLLRDTFNRAEMDNFRSELNQTVTVGNFTVEIPFYMSLSETDTSLASKMFYAEDNDADDCSALFYFEAGKLNVSDEQFRKQGEQAWNNLFESLNENTEGCVVTKEPSPIIVNGYTGLEGTWQFGEDGHIGNVTLALINDAGSGNVLVLFRATTDNTIFCYNSDFKKIINSITTQSASENTTSEAQETAPKPSNPTGVTPELKAFLDSYEEFMDEYVSFMKKYQASTDSSAMLMDYLNFMQKYSEFSEKADAYNTDEMSDADAAYYLEVTGRIYQKLLQAAS